MGTFILIGLGIIGEYLARIHEEVRGRPRYLIQARSEPEQAVRTRPNPAGLMLVADRSRSE
jgi:hypothetical protein